MADDLPTEPEDDGVYIEVPMDLLIEILNHMMEICLILKSLVDDDDQEEGPEGPKEQGH